ncbi:hypothetical protein DXB05_04300 [Clostridium sp. OF13-4]|nr:hypothetical protein DXB05_04300 [Clostridium sp. OF13-4]
MRQIPAAVCQCVNGNKNDCLHQIYLKEEALYKNRAAVEICTRKRLWGSKKFISYFKNNVIFFSWNCAIL